MSYRPMTCLGAAAALGLALLMGSVLQAQPPGRALNPPAGKEKSPDREKESPPALTPEQEVKLASNRYYAAMNQVLKGETWVMEKVWSHGPDVMLLTAFGGRQAGWDAVRGEFERQAELQMAGRIIPMNVVVRVAGDTGFVTCTEKCQGFGEFGGREQVTPRATNVFRLIDGEWKLVLHHSDAHPAFEAIDLKASKGRSE